MRSAIVYLVLLLFINSCKSDSSKNNKQSDSTGQSNEARTAPVEKLSKDQINSFTQKLSSLFDSNLINRNFNGGIIVAKCGNILYEKYNGYTNPGSKTDPITDTTSFHLASTSKPFTGMTILKLVQEGKIQLTDDLTKYFPEFPYANITIKDLLSHRSGLPNYLYFMEDKSKWPSGKMVSNKDVLDFLIQYQPSLNYTPGSRFNYCNTNYVLLALLIEKVTGQTYPNYLESTIFKPLGMNHTFVYTPEESGKVIMSYKLSGAIWMDDMFDNTYGDKNIYSTPRDMVKWDAALYNNFIRSSLLDSAYQPLSNESPSVHNYGLGWRMLNLSNGKKVIYHNGKWHGFTPAFARLIDEKAVIIILGNQMNKNIYSAAKHAYNVFGDYMQGNNTTTEEDDNSPHQTATPVPITKKEVPNKVNRAVEPNKNKARSAIKTPTRKKDSKKVEKKPVAKNVPSKKSTNLSSNKKKTTDSRTTKSTQKKTTVSDTKKSKKQ